MSNLPKNIQTYIDLVYSQKSELNSIQNLDERKSVACERAKLDPKSESVQKIIQMKDMVVNEQIFQHLITKNHNEYVLYIADQHFYWEILHSLMEPLEKEGKDSMLKDLDLKSKLSRSADELLERMNARALKIWGAEAEINMAMEKIRIMRPEERLKKKSA